MITEVKVTVKHCSQCPKFVRILIGADELRGTVTGYCSAMVDKNTMLTIQTAFSHIVPYRTISEKCPFAKMDQSIINLVREIVPNEKDCFEGQDTEDYLENLGYNSCRTEILQRLEEK